VRGGVLQESATGGEHLWTGTSVSGDFCYVGEAECTVSVHRSAWSRNPKAEEHLEMFTNYSKVGKYELLSGVWEQLLLRIIV